MQHTGLAFVAKRADPVGRDAVTLQVEEPYRLVEREGCLVLPSEESQRLASVRMDRSDSAPGRTPSDRDAPGDGSMSSGRFLGRNEQSGMAVRPAVITERPRRG